MNREEKRVILKKIMSKLEWTHEDAAYELNYSVKQIGNFIYGEANVPDELLLKIEEKFAEQSCQKEDWKPLWLRIGNFNIQRNFNQGDFVYYVPENSEIELYDPVKEREISGDKRVYLKFLNNSIRSGNLGMFQFMQQYGFVGQTSNVERKGDYEKLINAIFKLYIINDYFSERTVTDLKKIKENILKFKSYAKKSQKQWAKKLIGVAPNGYFELASDARSYFVKDMLDVINIAYMENKRPKDKFYNFLFECDNHKINWFLCDLVPISVNKVYKLQMEFGFRTLISFMYYELFQDIKNNIYPWYCNECRNLYLPEDLKELANDQYCCKKCTIK